jgi:type III secretion protein D
VRFKLKARADAADLELLEGSVVLLGHELTAPAQAILPLYLPLMIGDNAVAIGDPESLRWTEAERILAAAQPLLDDDDEDAPPTGQPWQYLLNNTNALVSRSMRFVPVLLIAVITVSALFAISSGMPAWPKMQPRPAKVQAVLLDEGFDGLSVSKSSEGEIRIEGVVATDADRARLRRVMTAHDWQPRLNVQTHEGMARQVEDFYMANGVEAAARAAGAGLVRLDVIGSNPEEAGRLQRLAMTEIKGLRRIDISMLPGADEGGRFEDMQEGGGKRVVSVIGGPQGHITTADGARYFPGAVLPTGHRIVSIEDTKVLVERNGSRSELNF